jgi:hypothetical protein
MVGHPFAIGERRGGLKDPNGPRRAIDLRRAARNFRSDNFCSRATPGKIVANVYDTAAKAVRSHWWGIDKDLNNRKSARRDSSGQFLCFGRHHLYRASAPG